VSSRNEIERLHEIERLQAEANYYRDRVAVRRAKLYRSGAGMDARLQELEREHERAEQRLRAARLRSNP
jgi:hypothetical protein